jgi:rRNA maturation protein Nop10
MGEVGKTCQRCGMFFMGNKCPKCGWEVLPSTPKPLSKEEKKKKVKGIYY